MKKSVFLLLCLFAFMVACTQAGNVSQAEIVTQSPQPVASATPLPTQIHATATPIPAETDGVVLQFWHPWTGNKASSIAALVAEFNRSNEQGIFIEEKSVADENFLMSEVLDALEQENMPDILAAPSRFNRSLYQQGVVLALDDLIANPETGISAEQRRTFPTVFWDEDVLEGVRYAVPAEYNLNILFYNQSWAQEMGFENPPASSEEFLNQACAAARFNAFDANDENNGTGGWIYNNEPVTMLSWMQAFGGGEIPADLNRGIEFNTAENQDAMEFLRTIYQLDCAWTGKESTPYAYFARRYALFYSGSVADWQRQLALDEIEGNTDEWIIIPYPGQDGDPIVNSATLSYAITRSEPEREQAAWVFIRWMLSDDVQIAISEETYSIPVTLAIVPELADMMDQHPAWQRLVQYLPLSRPLPAVSSWNILASLLKDVGWQVSQFNVAAADIPTILENLDTIANEVIHDN